MKGCRNPFLLKGKDYVKAVMEMGLPEEDLWALGQQTAVADYAAESLARCYDDGGLYALEKRTGSCFKCGEQGHRAAPQAIPKETSFATRVALQDTSRVNASKEREIQTRTTFNAMGVEHLVTMQRNANMKERDPQQRRV